MCDIYSTVIIVIALTVRGAITFVSDIPTYHTISTGPLSLLHYTFSALHITAWLHDPRFISLQVLI